MNKATIPSLAMVITVCICAVVPQSLTADAGIASDFIAFNDLNDSEPIQPIPLHVEFNAAMAQLGKRLFNDPSLGDKSHGRPL